MMYRIFIECSQCDFARKIDAAGLQDKEMLFQPATQHRRETGHNVYTEVRTIKEVIQ
jgi:hypothetical protein